MRTIFKIISFTGLALTIVPSILVFKEVIAMKAHYLLMAIGFALWFASAPFWIKSKALEGEEKRDS
jgi:hypothetical protein